MWQEQWLKAYLHLLQPLAPEKSLQNTKIDIQIKGNCSKGETQIHTRKEEMTKKKKEEEWT